MVEDGQHLPPLAYRMHGPLSFPLAHPRKLNRSPFMERQIEAVRLALKPVSKHSKLRAMARRLINERTRGAVDYYFRRARASDWGDPFNGQTLRQQLFEVLVTAVKPTVFVETGTDLGTTTELLAQFGKPVFSVEGQPRTYGFANSRLRTKRNVILVHDDSRKALRRWFDGPFRKFDNETLFFYLDAHLNNDLPQAEEIEMIFGRSPNAVVMIDDFAVPDDAGFGYDDYGPGKALNASYIASLVQAHRLAVFYPSADSQEETGMRRGCVVLAREIVHGATLRSLSLLRPAATLAARAPA